MTGDMEAAGRTAAHDRSSGWFMFWSGLADCPHVRPPHGEQAAVSAWWHGYDAEVRRLRRVWVRESVHA